MMMTVSGLTKLVSAHFREHAREFGLQADQVSAKYVLNWGGFVNASFTISDGTAKYHLKLTHDEDNKKDFRKWQRCHRILEERYHAPALIGWIDLSPADYSGLLFGHIDGCEADFQTAPALLSEVTRVVSRLHSDRELAEQLRPLESFKVFLDSFIGTYIRRFCEDLVVIESALPPFVSAATLRWMHEETRNLEALARGSSAFRGSADAPVHGDLHANHILVAGQGQWFWLDWDDLSLGDPALDYALLLWPLLRGKDGRAWQDFLMITDSKFGERMELYLRAQLLDEVIDVLADYVESAVTPELREHVQEIKREQHLEARRQYRQRYG